MSASGSSNLKYWLGGVLGVLGTIAPIATLGEQVAIVDIVVGGGLWFGIGFGVGAAIDTVRRKRGANASAPGNPVHQPASTVPPSQDGWYPDPFRRFHYRYWRSGGWTDQVSANGRTYTDQPG